MRRRGMLPEVVARLRCPHCAAGHGRADRTLRCAHGHSFDIAREGYVNLLRGHGAGGHGHARDGGRPGRDPRGGPLRRPHRRGRRPRPALLPRRDGPGLVLDVGAGTGHYLAAVLDAPAGRPRARPRRGQAAVRRAARAHPRAGAAVCDVWRGLPVADACADVVLDVFAPRNGAEFHRVLRPDGRLVVVTPTPRPPGRTRTAARADRRRPGQGRSASRRRSGRGSGSTERTAVAARASRLGAGDVAASWPWARAPGTPTPAEVEPAARRPGRAGGA